MNALPGPVSSGSNPLSSFFGCVLVVVLLCGVPFWVVGRIGGVFGPLESPPPGYGVTTTQNGTTQNPITLVQPNGQDVNDDLIRSQTNENQAKTFKTIEEGYAEKRLSEAESCDIRNDCNLYWQQQQPPQKESSWSGNIIAVLIGIILGAVIILRVLFSGR
jgi:hypothetical protein